MFRIVLNLFVVLLLQYNASAQLNNSPLSFNLEGKINIESAKVLLIPIDDSLYYPQHRGVAKGVINHGKFNFTGPFSYPLAFRLGVINDSEKLFYISDVFFIDSGIQKINCNVKIVREKLHISNATTKEENGFYRNAFIQINKEFNLFNKERDSVYKRYKKKNVPPEIVTLYSKKNTVLEHKRNLVLWRYTKKNPNSFVALWELIEKMNSGYLPIYDSIYSQLSNRLKKTVTGKRLYDQLRSSSVVNIGNKFPRLLLRNMKIKRSRVSINQNKKYTLIDFWFSHCFPCISQFDELKKLFKKYNKNKLDIISISVDDSAHINDWKNVIAKYSLPWKQYLDLNGKEADRLSINSYPTNFLLDKKGEIIATDIEPGELELKLKK